MSRVARMSTTTDDSNESLPDINAASERASEQGAVMDAGARLMAALDTRNIDEKRTPWLTAHAINQPTHQ